MFGKSNCACNVDLSRLTLQRDADEVQPVGIELDSKRFGRLKRHIRHILKTQIGRFNLSLSPQTRAVCQ